MLQAHGNVSQADNSITHGNNQATTSLAQQQSGRPARLRPQSLQAPSQNQNRRDPRISWSNGSSATSAIDLQQFADDLTNSLSFDDASLTASTGTNDTKDSRGRTMEQQDALAVAQNGGSVEYSDDEGHDDGADQDLDDDLMDRISSSPSIEDEDIDFDFVYALHTFVATVEGQANAVKGEPMMLLDDSNSYWWLVRVVKDSTIGYLPAEHIETPTERLARLNKHRNLDLSASMLGDQPETTRSKTGLRSGILRRRKTVAFAAPTYVDYEKEYSDESDPEDEAEALFAQQRADAKKQREEKEAAEEAATTKTEEASMDDETAKVKPLTAAKKEVTISSDALESISSESEDEEDDLDLVSSGKSEKDEGISRSRNGTVRNTDSFFKDDSVETKKITLTPNLLRDDNASRESTESGNTKHGFSLDKLEKDSPTDKKDDKKKKDKKEKDKKPGGLRGFFSRKDKKKSVDEDSESLGKRSMDTTDSRERDGADGEHGSPTPEGRTTPQRTLSSGKLHKHQARDDVNSVGTGAPKYVAEAPRNDVSNVPPTSMRIVENEQQQQVAQKAQKINNRLSMALPSDRSGPGVQVLHGGLGTITETSPSSNTSRSPADSVAWNSIKEENSLVSNPGISKQAPSELNVVPTATNTPRKQADAVMPISPVDDSPHTPNGPPALVPDSSSQDDQSISPSSSPELMGTDESGSTRQTTQGSTASDSRSSAASNVSTWNDVSLRSFFESSSDIRDMLVMVYDKSEVVPAGPEHPIAGPLFREQNAKLAEITTQLDHMLGDWLARKQRLRGSI
ncbi:hypothetical protein BROUX41_002455 [Berkeleyomyces rouxiae]|uniref:uncharacterized protein n=1 Tax=Berkeleyomyces rouxiae TaxID=2035830 RepID=UPI003B767A87